MHQYLPFADESFDALFHFGGVNLFNEPDKGLLEFVRVVKKGGIVAWGDEEMSPDFTSRLRRKILIRLNPGYLKTPPSPPKGLSNIKKNIVRNGLGYLYVAKKM
jgi:ubiquinone/menaquinone biosynthesis C-methylase UbiE